MFRFQQATAEALRALIYIARKGAAEPVSVNELVAQCEIGESSFRRSLPSLIRAGVVQVTQGRTGGVAFARDVQTVTALDVVEALEGQLGVPCPLGHGFDLSCPTCSVSKKLTDPLRSAFAKVPLKRYF